MINIHKNYSGKSYFKGETMYDESRDKEYKITLFGLTIFRHTEKFNIDLVTVEESKKRAGFKSN
jgi:hypothetical protein